MNPASVLEPFPAPSNKQTFLLDWELTMKCNLDCTYCGTGENGGHDNTTKHPKLADCLASLDFMYTYVDLYMQYRIPSLRSVILNVYGGESLHHPDIVAILQAARDKHRQYQGKWALQITTTTNAIIPAKKLERIIPLVDHFTASYHTENSTKQKQQFKDNLLLLKTFKNSLKCIVLMHTEPTKFADAQQMITWLNENKIEMLPRQLDHPEVWDQFKYDQKQVVWFNKLYQSKNHQTTLELDATAKQTDLTQVGRACCGGRQVCTDQNFSQRHFFVDNKFTDWSCSVNWFFLFIKQVNGKIYVNKDCKMNFDGTVSPIGNLNNTAELLQQLQTQLTTGTVPVMQCKKESCWCGLCAPKARERSTYDHIIKKYQSNYTDNSLIPLKN